MCVPEFSMSPDLLSLNFEHATMVAASTRKADGLNSQIPVVQGGGQKHKVRKTMTKNLTRAMMALQ